jgi:transposase
MESPPQGGFGSASAVHAHFLQWMRSGFLASLWRAGPAEYDDMEGIAWRWQSIDGAMVKAPLAQEAVLNGMIIEAPDRAGVIQYLCADKGHSGKPARQAMIQRGYIPHVKQRGEEIEAKGRVPGYRARRWMVEACHSWFNRFRKIRVRHEKRADSHLALLHLAAAIITFRKVGII